MTSGRLSFSLDETGERRIDVAELERVFGVEPAGNGAAPVQSNATHHPEVAMLQRWLDDRDETIRQLWHRLDSEVEERRRLLALLTDRRPWWRRWLR
jgi:hypothetical protein